MSAPPTPLAITALAFVSSPLVLSFSQTLPQAQVQATFSDASTEIINGDLRYTLTCTSSNTSVASFIDGRGMMYFSQSGASTLTVASGAITATTALTVTPLLVAITITGLRRVLVGQTLQLQLLGTYNDGTTGAITAEAAWTVGSPSILAVNNTGLISAHAAGTSAVSVIFAGLSTSFYVNVPSIASTELIAPAGVLPGQTAQFALIQTYSDGSTQDITSSASWFTSRDRKSTRLNSSHLGIS